MALAIANLLTLFADDTDLTSYNVTAVTPTANRLLVALLFGNVNVGLLTSTFGESHLSWTQRVSVDNGASRVLQIYTANVDASPGSITLVKTWGGAAAGTGCSILEVAGHDTANPIRQVASNGATSADPNFTFPSALLTGNAYIGGFTISRQVPGSTPPAGWTETCDNGYATPAQGLANGYRVNGETGTLYTFTAASGGWLAAGIEINADPGQTAYPKVHIIGG